MPSTPRMIEIERKASQPGGPALTREEVAEWHLLAGHISGRDWSLRPVGNQAKKFLRPDYSADIFRLAPNISASAFPDYSASVRYLDSTGYKR